MKFSKFYAHPPQKRCPTLSCGDAVDSYAIQMMFWRKRRDEVAAEKQRFEKEGLVPSSWIKSQEIWDFEAAPRPMQAWAVVEKEGEGLIPFIEAEPEVARPRQKQRRDWKRPPQWQEVKGEALSFKALPRECVEREEARKAELPPPRGSSFIERAFWAERRGFQTMRIARLTMPNINGHFFQYERKEGETLKRWRGRLIRMRRSINFAKKIAKEEGRLDLPLFEQIRRSAQTAGSLKNRFSLLREVELRGSEIDVKLVGVKRVRSLPKVGPRTNWGYEYRTMKLLHKQKLYDYQQEWREARLLRKEKMGRALLVLDNHRVVSLKAALLREVEKFARQTFKNQHHMPQGEGGCCSKKKDTIETASQCTLSIRTELDDGWIHQSPEFAALPDEPWEVSDCEEATETHNQIFRLNVKPEDYQGYGPHDWHWPPQRPPWMPQGEMADVDGKDAQGDTSAEVDSKSTVEIQSQTGTSLASSLPVATIETPFSKFSNAESVVSDSTFHDRWYTIKQITWDQTQSFGHTILDINLPEEVLNNTGFLNSPSGIGFKQHMYWSGNMKIKIVANTNIRQYGQIQFSFYYGSNQDIFYKDLRTNVYTSSQRLHALLTANFSNDIILDIPFEYIFPVMAINQTPTGKHDDQRTIGNLIGLILVPLTAAATCPTTASIKVLISFSDNKFSGMVGTSIARAEMFSTLASVIAVKSILDKNRDAPTVITPGTPVIPINASSWCMGTGQATYNNVLRLNPNAVLPYPEGRIPNLDELNVNFVKDKFGLFKIIDWTANSTVGQSLIRFDATPLDLIEKYPSQSFGGKEVFMLPPVAVLSSLFAYWRGSLDLRVDIVGATELSGSILIAYVPRVLSTRNLTMEQCFSCAHTIFDIHENRQIAFNIPYVASHMFWPRARTVSSDFPQYSAPGSVHIFVYNKLIVNCTIPDNCKLLLYMKGGVDFEVSIPCSPSLGLGFNPIVYLPQDAQKRAVFKEGYEPVYGGTWRSYYADSGKLGSDFTTLYNKLYTPQIKGMLAKFSISPPILRYGNGSDHVSQFELHHFLPEPNYPVCCKFNKSLSRANVNIRINDHASYGPDCKNYILIFRHQTFVYGCPLSDLMARDFKRVYDVYIEEKRFTHQDEGIIIIAQFWVLLFLGNHVKQTEYTSWLTVPTGWWSGTFGVSCFPEYQSVLAEIGENEKLKAPLASPQDSAQSNASKAVFGEQFVDLKDYCRRYQLYASGQAKIKDFENSETWRSITIRFPVMPQGLSLELGTSSAPYEYWNRTRDGPIPIIASAYRFFTGGIRYRIVINILKKIKTSGNIISQSKIFVQHRPNVVQTSNRVIIQAGSSLGTDDLELPGYAAYHQVEALNNVLSVEVPFYLPSIRSYAQRPGITDLARRFSNLGELVVGLTTTDMEDFILAYDIYYSLADDARFSVFVGYPPVIDCTKIPAVDPPSASVSEEYEFLPRGEMGLVDLFMGSTSKKDVEETIANVSELSKALDPNEVKSISSNLNSITGSLKDKICNFLPSMENIELKFHKYLDLLINAVTNLVHIIINFNLRTIGVALVSFFTQLKIISYSATSSLVENLSKFFSCMKSDRDLLSQPLSGNPQGEMADSDLLDDDKAICGYVSSLIAGVAAFFSFVPKFCKARKAEIAEILLTGIGKFTFTANHLFTFIKNNLIAIKRIGEWLFGDHPSIAKLGFLRDCNESVFAWAKEVLDIVDPRKECEVFTSVRKANRVYQLALQANILNLKMLELNITPSQSHTLNYLIKKIVDLRDRLARSHTAPPVKFEPFVFEITGPTGVGKSELLKILPYKIFSKLHITHEGELIYHRALGNAYWNNLRNQPVCVVDEKFPVKGPGFLDVQLAELFQLKSSCVFNPPMADIPDKNIRYNPLMVAYASNCPFPTLSEVLDMQAVYRRRDSLIDVRMKERYRVNHGCNCKYSDLTAEERGKPEEFSYLEFRFHRDPSVDNVQDNMWTAWIDYPVFFQELTNKFKDFFVVNEKKYRIEIERMKTILPVEHETSTITEIFSNAWLDQLGDHRDQPELQFSRRVNAAASCYTDKKNLYSLKIRLAFAELLGSSCEIIDDLNNQILKIENPGYVPVTQNPDGVFENQIEVQEAILAQAAVERPVGVPQGEGDEQSKCLHYCMQDVLVYFANALTYSRADDGWTMTYDKHIIDAILENCPDYTLEDIQNSYEVFKKKFSKQIEEAGIINIENGYMILRPTCKSFKCLLQQKQEYQEFLESYMKKNQDINNHLRLGRIPHSKLPEVAINPEKGAKKEAEVKEFEQALSGWDKFKNFFKNLKESFYHINWQKWLKRIGIAIIVFGFIGTLLGLWSYCTTGSAASALTAQVSSTVGVGASAIKLNLDKSDRVNKILGGEGHVSGDSKVMRQSISKVNTATKQIAAQPKGEMSIKNEDFIKQRIRRNTFFLGIETDSGWKSPGRCLGICGNFAIIVSHFWEAWMSEAKKLGSSNLLYVPSIDTRLHCVPVSLYELKIYDIENSGLSLIELPKRIPPFKDIRPHILSKSSHGITNFKGAMCEMVIGGSSLDRVDMELHSITYKSFSNIKIGGCDKWDAFDIHDGYEYSGFSGPGRCGSILLGSGVQAPIMGIHVAGYPNTSWGMSEIIYREMFDSLGNQASPVSIPGEGQMSRWFVDANVIGVGKVSPKLAHVERGKSRIVPSEVQKLGDFPIYTQPAVLSKNDPRIKDNPFSPMTEGCKHHGKPLKPFRQEHIQLAVDDLKGVILSSCPPERKPSRLSVDEAVAGFEGKPGYEHLEFSTSEGFPFVGLRPVGASNKKWLFEFDEYNKYIRCNPLLSRVLEQKWQQRLSNEIPVTVFTDCLKDCTIEHEKVFQPGKTRIFSMSPVDFTIQQRQCTLDFVVAYMTNRHKLEHMIGCNPDSEEWTFLARRLLEKGNNIVTGDYSKYGDTIPCELIHAAFEIIRAWYRFYGCEDEELFQQLKIMPYEIGNSIHLMFDFLYYVVCGQPSGNSLTVILNSIINSLYIRLAWLEIMANTPYASLIYFHDFVSFSSYGDDVIMAIKDIIKDLFNGIQLGAFFGKYNLKFTNADKSNTLVAYTKLEEADFLKRGFLLHPTRNFPQLFLAPLKRTSIEDTINWVWQDSFGRDESGSPSFRQMSLQVCEDSVRNAYSRGPEYYKEWSSKLTSFWLEQSERFFVKTWQQMDQQIFDWKMDLSPYHKWQINSYNL